jgi:hypothetical protein
MFSLASIEELLCMTAIYSWLKSKVMTRSVLSLQLRCPARIPSSRGTRSFSSCSTYSSKQVNVFREPFSHPRVLFAVCASAPDTESCEVSDLQSCHLIPSWYQWHLLLQHHPLRMGMDVSSPQACAWKGLPAEQPYFISRNQFFCSFEGKYL